MRILFIYTNIDGFHQDTYSFGLASIVSVTKAAGHSIKVMLIHSRDDFANIFTQIADFQPRVIGFSAVSSQFSFIKEIAEGIKEMIPGVITVCGGIHPTIYPESILETRHLDGIFIGESEGSFVEFLARVETSAPYEDIDNFAYVKDNRLIKNKLKPRIKDLDVLPFPDKDIYPYVEIIEKIKYAPFLFSRGCPYMCSYCSNHAIARAYGLQENSCRFRSAESSIREIEEASNKFSISKIIIGDDIFGIDSKWRQEFCDKYRKRVKIKFQCLLRANLVDEELICSLKEAGCYRVSIGIESGNEYIRNEIMNRRMSNSQIINAFRLARKYGLETNALCIIGVPGESEQMLQDTIALLRNISPTSAGVNIYYPYRGTQLGDRCFKEGLVNERIYSTFSSERRESVLNLPEEYRRKLSYLRENWDDFINPIYSRKRLMKFLRRTSLWQQLRALKNSLFLNK